MKKLALVFGITLAFSTTAMAADIAISTQAGWFGQAAADREMQVIVDSVKTASVERFTAAQHTALAAWVKDHTGDGVSDLLILCGQFPSTIYPAGNAQPNGSLAELFLDDGNCIINTGDYMFYVVDGAGSNAEPGLETMMDLAHISMWDDDTAVVVTADGKKYTPSLQDYAVDRPWHLDELQGDWYAELILAQNAAGTRAEPAIITNRVTGGRLGTFYQTSGQDNDPRGKVMSEWINNWYLPKFGGPNPFARKANPSNGSMLDQTWVEASWKAGDLAKQHDVYFGESFEDVNAATPASAGVYVGRQATTKLLLGRAGGVVPTGLVPGKTYYWRVDEINDSDPGSPWRGKVWSFTVRPTEAWAPSPADGTKKVDPNEDLNWNLGMGAIIHYVFFGESLDEIANMPMGMPVAQPPYDPGTLKFNTTYYWRVDEYAFPANKTYTGNLWSFTTLGKDSGAKADYFAGMALEGDPIQSQTEYTIDHSWGDGAVAGGLADAVSARWRANLEVPSTGTYQLITSTDDGVRLWLNGRLIIDEWIDQGTTDWRATVDLIAGQYYMLQMEYYENGGGAVAQLSWQSDTLAREIIPAGWLLLPVRATNPWPNHGDPNASQAPILTWIPGDGATGHDVYFGEDANAVAKADTTTTAIYRGRQAADATSFDAGPLEWGKTFYWRVDEVNADGVLAGAVWSFTTATFLPIDNFESYTNNSPNRVFQTWLDGWGFSADEFFDAYPGNGTGAMIGYDPGAGNIMETSIAHGFQSMPFSYNNADTPFYSETERTFASPQNWTVNGMNTLSLQVYGYPAQPASVAITETAGKMSLTGSGSDIWNNSDQFTYAYKALNGDGTIVAKVTSNGTGSQTWAKGGVMIRDSLDGGSMHAMMVVTGGGGNGGSFQWRATTGGASSGAADPTSAVAPPYWVKLERLGDTFNGYVSTDGSSWTAVGAQEVVMAGPAYIGICVTAHLATEQRTYQFESIKTTGSVTGAWQGAEIMSPRYNGSQDLYVAIQDSANKTAVVKNATAVNTAGWTQVKIPLSSFSGASATKVKKMIIGVGDRTNPVADGTGMLFIDDIRAIKE